MGRMVLLTETEWPMTARASPRARSRLASGMAATAPWAVGGVRGLVGVGSEEVGDGPLLDRFVACGDEPAFAELLRRYGPLVLGVCRQVLRDADDAEDAFQATFLVLAKRAASLRRQESL